MRARSPRICSEQQGGVGGVLLQHGAASGMTGAHLMTVDAPSTLPLRLADLSGSYNIQMTGTEEAGMRGSPRERRGERPRGEISVKGLIWLCLASFTPSGEGGNEAIVASFGTPLTRTHCASVASWWPPLASSRVARSGETLNSVARLHGNDVYHPNLLPSREKGPAGDWDAKFLPSRERRL